MQSESNPIDGDHTIPEIETGDAAPADPTPAVSARADAYRERLRRNQVVAAQIARARAAGGKPSEAEAARLIAEFQARGGQVTVCPEPDEAPPATQGRGSAAKRRTA